MRRYIIHPSLILVLVLAGLCLAPGYAPSGKLVGREAKAQQFQCDIWNRTELYFGSAKPDGSVVSESEFMKFVDAEVTPRFPDGLTALTGYGQFRNAAGMIVKERSMVLILLYPLQMRDTHRKLEEIREAYKRAFQQESVLRVDSLARVSF